MEPTCQLRSKFFEKRGILGWSIMLLADWLIWRLLKISAFLNSAK